MQSIDFKVGDIIVDTKYNDFFGIGGGHTLMVINVSEDKISVTHTGQFGLLPATHIWKGYKSFIGKDSTQYTKYLIRWKGPELDKICEKIIELTKIFYILRNLDVEMCGFELVALKIAYNQQCFNQVIPFKMFKLTEEISHHSLYYVLGLLIKNKTFICSSYVMLIWKLALEQVANPDNFNQSLDDVGLKIDPFECLPKNILELPKYFPNYWEVIEYHTKKFDTTLM